MSGESKELCWNCNFEEHSEGSALCTSCEEKGYWVDPAGGIHPPEKEGEFDDPAAMYE